MMSSTSAAPPKTQSQAERGGGVSNGAGGPQAAGPFSFIEINLPYFKTWPGICKILELILGIICMACASPAYLSGTHWFLFVVVTSFISSLIWTAIYFLSIRRELTKLPIDWTLTEFLNTGISAVLYVIAFIVQIIIWVPYYGSVRGANIAAGVFGILNAAVYWYATILLYNEYKDSRAA